MLESLENKALPIEAANRLETKSKGPMPGYESMPSNRRIATEINPLYGSTRALTSMCAALGNCHAVRVFDVVFAPSQYLRDALKGVSRHTHYPSGHTHHTLHIPYLSVCNQLLLLTSPLFVRSRSFMCVCLSSMASSNLKNICFLFELLKSDSGKPS